MKAITLALLLTATTSAADARVTRIEISKREPFAAGQAFGSTGAYEKIVGRYHGALDPSHPLNATIVDLDKAPRNAQGQVEYAADFYILRPVDLAKGNGAIFYEASNRGSKAILTRFNNASARSNDPSTVEHAGNGFLMRRGFTLVWNGWMPGLPSGNDLLQITVPSASGLAQTTWDELLFNDGKTMQGRLTYKAATTDKNEAKLIVRERNSDTPMTVPAEQWEFVDARTIRLLPAGTPFRVGMIYQLIYKAENPPVNGIGFASTRDLISFLRHAKADDAGTPNPLAGEAAISRVLGHGNSQTGRYLRDFIYSGFNEDESNRIVLDGALPNVAAGRIYLNYRFSQPNRIIPAGHGFMLLPGATFPYAYETQTDPFTGARDGILARCSARGNCPKIIHTTTGTEYWQSGQSLVTTDALGRADGAAPENVRIYHFAGTHHVGTQATMPKGVCAMPPNHVDYSALLRADLVSLDRWVSDGTPPPPSRHPRIADGSLVENTAPGVAIPGFAPARGPNQRPRFDYGPDFAKGIIGKALPVALSDRYGILVPKVDRDGNETSGVVLPDVAVPVATTTGWSVRGASAGGGGELCYLDGAALPFAKTKAEREQTGDGRLSLEERYQGPADYAAKIHAAAMALQKDGLLLTEDVERITARASSVAW